MVKERALLWTRAPAVLCEEEGVATQIDEFLSTSLRKLDPEQKYLYRFQYTSN